MAVSTLDIIVADQPGKSVSVSYRDHEPIFYLIHRTSSLLGDMNDNKVYDRLLYMNGILLENQLESISRYRIFGSALTYQARRILTLHIYIMEVNSKTLVNKKITLECRDDQTPQDVIAKAAQKGGSNRMPSGLYIGKRVIHNYMTLFSSGVQDGSTLRIDSGVGQAQGGGGGPGASGVMFEDVSDTQNIRKVNFSKRAPRGRTARSGTNVECNCECTPRYRVICPTGWSVIELSDATFTCPSCSRKDKIVPVTVGFMDCKYRFYGIKSNGEQYTSEWKEVTEDDQYQLFYPSKQVSWKRLVMESAKSWAREDCIMCLRPMDTSTTLACGHHYHEDCHQQWNSCPQCRLNQHLKM
jgi:hypothetical protein